MTYNIVVQSSETQDAPARHAAPRSGLRILLMLVGILLALNILADPVSMDASPAGNRGYQAVQLRSTGDIQVVNEIELPHERMFGGHSTGAVWGDTHIWGHIQRILVGDAPLYILYYEFRNAADARAALSKLGESAPASLLPLEARAFGRFLAIVQGMTDAEGLRHFGSEVFEAISVRAAAIPGFMDGVGPAM